MTPEEMDVSEKSNNRPFFGDILIELREMRRENEILRSQLEEARNVISHFENNRHE